MALVSALFCEVHIWEPSTLRSVYKAKPLEYTIANFGTVPYGHSIYGTVFKANPLLACSELSPLKWDRNSGTLIIYVERGECHFAQKVYNAQKMGAGLVIIGDTNNEDISRILAVERTVELMDKLHIPSILIPKKDAETFKNTLESTEKEGQLISLAIDFPLVKAYDMVNIKMILQVDDFRSYDAIINLHRYHTDFKDHMSLTVHYKIFKNIPVVLDNDNCVTSKNTYCVLNGHPLQKKLGLLDETLKQMCLFNHAHKEFITYMSSIRTQCFSIEGELNPGFSNCTLNHYNKYVSKQTRDKLANCIDSKSDAAIEMFEQNNDNIKYYLINYSPIVFINGYIYKGNYSDSDHLMESFCNSFESPPEKCNKLEIFQQYKGFSSYGLLWFVIVSVVLTFLISFGIIIVFYVVYRKRMAKNFEAELSVKVNEALSKYYGSNEDDYSGITQQLDEG